MFNSMIKLQLMTAQKTNVTVCIRRLLEVRIKSRVWKSIFVVGDLATFIQNDLTNVSHIVKSQQTPEAC